MRRIDQDPNPKSTKAGVTGRAATSFSPALTWPVLVSSLCYATRTTTTGSPGLDMPAKHHGQTEIGCPHASTDRTMVLIHPRGF